MYVYTDHIVLLGKWVPCHYGIARLCCGWRKLSTDLKSSREYIE